MAGITVEDLRARHARLVEDRTRNQEQLAACQEREVGYKYVLGELEMMIAQLEQRAGDAVTE